MGISKRCDGDPLPHMSQDARFQSNSLSGFGTVPTVSPKTAPGVQIDDLAPNLSFFFSNGTDPEYTAIGRVARCI